MAAVCEHGYRINVIDMGRNLRYLLSMLFVTGVGLWAYRSLTNNKTINVGLYPWVPRLEQFQATLQDAWDEQGTGYSLNFVGKDEWDGGYNTNPDHLDVFVFDAINLRYFKKLGYLAEIAPASVENLSDILPYARNGVTMDNSMYGIPLLGCGNFLFYQKDDSALAKAKSFSEVTGALGYCTYTSEVPPDRRGMMADMAGGTTNATLYVEVIADNTGSIPAVLPDNLDPDYVRTMNELMSTASYYNVTDCNLDGQCGTDQPYVRAVWFNNGAGRSYIGFTESMSQIDEMLLDEITFKPMPLAGDNSINLFYSDIVGINATTVPPEKMKVVLQLANLMASADIVTRSIGPDQSGTPQYLMPVRSSVFETLGVEFPKYREMKSVVTTAAPELFVLPDNSKEWIAQMKNNIKSACRKNYRCGCDFKSTLIGNQQEAEQQCPVVCQSHGGWNRQWVPEACGCNSCDLQ